MKARSLRGAWREVAAVLLSAGVGGAAALYAAPARNVIRPSPMSSARRPVLRAGEVGDGPDRACLARRKELGELPALPLPVVDQPELRAQLFGRTKAVPVLFLSLPEPDPLPAASSLRKLLEASPGYATFDTVVGKVRQSPELARAVFLREGYLYTESPELAALFGSLTLSLLFHDAELRIVRGAETLSARRLTDGDYEYTSGEDRGRKARLLLFDRVARADAPLSPSRHVDVRSLARSLGFDELRVERATSELLAAEARYGEHPVPTLLRVHEDKLALSCEAPGSARAAVLRNREDAERAERVQARLLSVVKEQVDEALPFDEPKTEDGQQDGQLRPEWRRAYALGKGSFEFNGDRYAVFDAAGRPRPPQVCIDFVLDTFERASGTWWQPRSQSRQRVRGRLEFEGSELENRRSVESFIGFARAHPEAFDVYEPPAEAKVPLRNRGQFFAELFRARAQFKRGDVVAILGPRDDEKLHYHSFLIVGSDPLTGMPIEVAANAGRPRIRSWEGEMQNAPRRSIVARVRPRPVWLEAQIGPENGVSADAPEPLPAGEGPQPAAG